MCGDYEPNDRVRVSVKGKVYEGIVLPRPDLEPKDHLTLKLGSGYNIGVEKSSISSVEVVEKFSPPKAAAPEKETVSGDYVSVLSTGGTIASKLDYYSGAVSASFTAHDLLESMPELSTLSELKASSIMNVMSEDMNPGLWADMAKAIYDEVKAGAAGVVVTHGTDTMHYSTAAMSFMVQDLGVPVVFTGAQRSTDRGSADSFLNMYCSVAFAASDFAGVYLLMHGSMSDDFCFAHKGTKVRKMHTTRRDAFKSINCMQAARVGSDGSVQALRDDLPKRRGGEPKLFDKLNGNVELVRIYPGMRTDLFDFYLEKGVDGLVLEGTALGHVPTKIAETSIIPKIEELVEAGVLVAMTTQCVYGRVNPYVYTNLREVSSRGVLYLSDLTSETAYVKMMWALANSKGLEGAKDLMLENVVGEFESFTPITG